MPAGAGVPGDWCACRWLCEWRDTHVWRRQERLRGARRQRPLAPRWARQSVFPRFQKLIARRGYTVFSFPDDGFQCGANGLYGFHVFETGGFNFARTAHVFTNCNLFCNQALA